MYLRLESYHTNTQKIESIKIIHFDRNEKGSYLLDRFE